MNSKVDSAKSQMKRAPKGEDLLAYEAFSYGVDVRIETCHILQRASIRLVIQEDGELVLTRRLLVLKDRKETIKDALQIGRNYFSMNEGRLALEHSQLVLIPSTSIGCLLPAAV